MSEENKRYYIPVRLFVWDKCRAGPFPVKCEDHSVGFLEAFESLEDAQKAIPDTEMFVIEEFRKDTESDLIQEVVTLEVPECNDEPEEAVYENKLGMSITNDGVPCPAPCGAGEFCDWMSDWRECPMIKTGCKDR